MANTVLAGDYSGLISFKGDKKGLLITENKFFGAKKTFINKTRRTAPRLWCRS